MRYRLVVSLLLVASALLFFAQQQTFAACDYPSFCDTQSHPGGDPTPGKSCTIVGVTTNVLTGKSYGYHYASTQTCGAFFGISYGTSNTCVPRCGFLGSGFCCEPNNAKDVPPDPSKRSQAPPCSSSASNGQCNAVSTALGNIQTNIASVTRSVFSLLLGLSGGVAILLIIAAGYQLMTSQGNPEKVKEARERLTAAIVGLLFIIFSVAILQIIGVTILQIPGFRP